MFKHILTPFGLVYLLLACSGGPNNSAAPSGGTTDTTLDDSVTTPVTLPPNLLTTNATGDITSAKLVNRNPDCSAYVGSYSATITAIQQNTSYNSNFTISADSNQCTFTSNNIPNHNTGGNTTNGRNFANDVKPNSINYVLNIPRNPVKTDTAIYVRKRGGYITMNGILLNGVDLDMDSAFCYDATIEDIKLVGCGLTAEWYAVPAANPANVVLDEYTGHPFDGRYHYHGDNHGLSHVDTDMPSAGIVDASGSPVIGFAPDGFPIYGHYFYDSSIQNLRKAKSSWVAYTGERTSPVGSINAAPPIASFERGRFVEDMYYSAGSGDLDECNGMTDAYGNYGYYYTEDYPYGPLCSFATPHASFEQLSSTAYIASP